MINCKKYFISSDIHGFFDEWSVALKEAGFDIDNPDHIVVVLGDLLDRGLQAKECLRFLMYDIPKDRRILIKGNHEELLEQAIARTYFESYDIHNGTDKTVYQLTNIYPDITDSGFNTSHDALVAMKDDTLWNRYISECVDFYEVGDNIFVHGWIPCYDWGAAIDWREGDWKDARWLNGMEKWYRGLGLSGKTIWCGHWHTSYAHCWFENDGPEFNETFYGDPVEMYDSEGNRVYANFNPFEAVDSEGCGIIAMDSCVSYSGFVNVKVLEI